MKLFTDTPSTGVFVRWRDGWMRNWLSAIRQTDTAATYNTKCSLPRIIISTLFNLIPHFNKEPSCLRPRNDICKKTHQAGLVKKKIPNSRFKRRFSCVHREDNTCQIRTYGDSGWSKKLKKLSLTAVICYEPLGGCVTFGGIGGNSPGRDGHLVNWDVLAVFRVFERLYVLVFSGVMIFAFQVVKFENLVAKI